MELHHIEPGIPGQNAFIERFNHNCRKDTLNAYLFENLDPVSEITQE